MLLHYVLTLQWNDASAPSTTHSVPGVDGPLTLSPAPRTTTEDGTLEFRNGMTSQDVFRDVLARVRTVNALPDGAGTSVLHWSLSPNEISASTPLHYALTLQWNDASTPLATNVPGIGSIVAFKTGPSTGSAEGIVEPAKGTTREALFRDVLAHVRTVNALPDGAGISVLHWSLSPNEVI
ncbi:hypothetical protein [Streptomyces sp. NPDC015125]|uniref:hypothetical protein n=1 Tax=Streptomyces sp. NPDC015125 TaxID=3364938 RepID=UPI0036FF8B60